ncbi:hypothetical protein Ancab_015080 [Ancistrocladus abbreviatus]
MLKNSKIAQCRQRLDKTLESHQLTDEKSLKSLVKDQILRSPELNNEGYIDNLVKKRAAEVSDFLNMLRSASDDHVTLPNETPNGSWKLKHANEECRVMYQEGPLGSPFHTLLVEGHVDAPLDTCLYVAWEASFFPTLFPESRVPSCKVTSKCLQKVRIGEQIILVRMKLSWPLSNRDAIIHYIELECFEDDLIIVLMNTIPDAENICNKTHGFTIDGLQDLGHTVRVGLGGGFAFQKVTENRSFFRTLLNLDLKLEFVPPSFINFLSRQVTSNAFRVFQKTVTSVYKADGKGLCDPIYKRVREGFYLNGKSKTNLEMGFVRANACTDPKEHNKDIGGELKNKVQQVFDCDSGDESSSDYESVIDWDEFIDSEEEEDQTSKKEEDDHKWENHKRADEDNKSTHQANTHDLKAYHFDNEELKLSPLVGRALGSLEKAVSAIRGVNEVLLRAEADEPKHLIMEDQRIFSETKSFLKSPKAKVFGRPASQEYMNTFNTHNLRLAGPNSISKEVNPWKVAPTSPQEDFKQAHENASVASYFIRNGAIEVPFSSKALHDNNQITDVEANGIGEGKSAEHKRSRKLKKWALCCVHPAAGQLVSS